VAFLFFDRKKSVISTREAERRDLHLVFSSAKKIKGCPIFIRAVFARIKVGDTKAPSAVLG
jgi:hypothetical protein